MSKCWAIFCVAVLANRINVAHCFLRATPIGAPVRNAWLWNIRRYRALPQQSRQSQYKAALIDDGDLTALRGAGAEPEEHTGSDIDLTGKTAFVGGVGDSSGYGWAIARRLAEAGARISVGTWPPVLGIFQKSLESGKFDDDRKLSNGKLMEIEKIYPFDAVYDTPENVPDDVKTNKRYSGLTGFTVSEVAQKLAADFGKIDMMIHSLANGPEVTKPLMETSRNGYLQAVSASAYSLVSMVKHMGPVMNKGGSVVSLTYAASEKVVPGYGGGMSSAKSALESDTRVLAFEAGRKYGIRVNTISAGPLKSRAASAIGKSGDKSFIDYAIQYSEENAPIQQVVPVLCPNSLSIELTGSPSRRRRLICLLPFVTDGSRCNGDDIIR
eukprot:Selendium_serpulae@DN6443_c2_g1_i13.p2